MMAAYCLMLQFQKNSGFQATEYLIDPQQTSYLSSTTTQPTSQLPSLSNFYPECGTGILMLLCTVNYVCNFKIWFDKDR